MAREELLDPTPSDGDDGARGFATDLTGGRRPAAVVGRQPPAAHARGVRRSDGVEAPAVDHPRGGPPTGPGRRPLPLRRAAGARQDVAGRHRRPRDGRDDARDLRSGAGPPGRPGRHPDQARRHRRPVHRRDPPPVALGRRGAVPGDGGLRARHRARKGSGGPVHPARPSPVLPRRRDHQNGTDHRPAPRPIRAGRPSRLLRAGRPRGDRAAGGEHPRRRASTGPAQPRSPVASRGTPRIANRLLRRVRDVAEVEGDGHIDAETARVGLELFGIDELGLDKVDRSILSRSAVSSAAARWACRRWPSPCRSRPRPSRTSTSRTSSNRACCCGPLGAGWPPPAAWQHLGLVAPGLGASRRARRRCSTCERTTRGARRSARCARSLRRCTPSQEPDMRRDDLRRRARHVPSTRSGPSSNASSFPIGRSGSRTASSPGRCSPRPVRRDSWPWRSPSSTAEPGVDDFRYSLIVIEELCRADVYPHGMGMTLHNDVCLPYFLDFTATTSRRLAGSRASSRGETITAVAMTEPGMGSDLASMSTTAIRDGDVLHRQRVQDVHHQRDHAGPGDHRGARPTRPSVTPECPSSSSRATRRGFERGRNLDKVGMHAQDTAELFFNDCRVPAANLLGEEGQGFKFLVKQPPPGAPVDLHGRRGPRPGDADVDDAVRQGASGVRTADRDRSRRAASCWPRCSPR